MSTRRLWRGPSQTSLEPVTKATELLPSSRLLPAETAESLQQQLGIGGQCKAEREPANKGELRFGLHYARDFQKFLQLE